MSTERLQRVSEVFLVPFNQIVISDEINNARIDMGDIDELASSIECSGLKTPLLVKKARGENEYVLIHGKRRYEAIKSLISKGVDYPKVKCFCAPLNYKTEDSLFDQILLNDGKPYSNLEQGIVFAQLLDRGYNISEISKKIGKSITHVNACIEMSSLPKKVQNMIADHSVSGHTAVQLSKIVETEEELLNQLETAVDNAPATPDGGKKKVTARSIEKVATLSPMKKLEMLKDALKQQNYETPLAQFFYKLVSRVKAGESVDSLMELFK